MTREQIEKLAYESQKVIESPLEKIICTQEDASLRSPGVPAHYYRFLYQLARIVKPKLTLELGTHSGISAACLAEGYPEGSVITVNNRNELMPECARENVIYEIRDSLSMLNLPGKIDILFIDTDHDGIRCLQEYNLYIEHMRIGGIVMFDDISLFDCMRDFWKEFNPAEGEKFTIPVHGGAGFGVVLLHNKEAQDA